MLFPFMKLFPTQELKCFEIFLAFIFRWTQPIFTDFPSLPEIVIDQIELLLREADPKLPSIVAQLGLTQKLWESLLNLYTDLFNKTDWLQIFDFLFAFSEYPELFYLIIVTIILHFKNDLLSFAKRNNIQIELKSTKNSVALDKNFNDGTILENIQAAEELLYDRELEDLSNKIALTSNQREQREDPKFQSNREAFIIDLLSKVRTIPAKIWIASLNKTLKRTYSQGLLILKFQNQQQLQVNSDLHYPLFPFNSKLII